LQGGKFVGQEEEYLVEVATGKNISIKGNLQSLLREVTYDPRLGQLYFSPVRCSSLSSSQHPLATQRLAEKA
jgi:hypothetical protein